jgi:hypothetical protein
LRTGDTYCCRVVKVAHYRKTPFFGDRENSFVSCKIASETVATDIASQTVVGTDLAVERKSVEDIAIGA